MTQLSERELEVVLRLANCNRWISHDLGISEQTVKNHIRNVARKLDLPAGPESKRLLIVKRCLAAGLVREEELVVGQKRERWYG